MFHEGLPATSGQRHSTWPCAALAKFFSFARIVSKGVKNVRKTIRFGNSFQEISKACVA